MTRLGVEWKFFHFQCCVHRTTAIHLLISVGCKMICLLRLQHPPATLTEKRLRRWMDGWMDVLHLFFSLFSPSVVYNKPCQQGNGSTRSR
ncbi:hypothetical protein MHYP_G00032440 [Metynnis hypsauchen]